MDKCTEVQADGDELLAIKDRFANIPMPAKKAVVIWKGDLAQFIYDNIT